MMQLTVPVSNTGCAGASHPRQALAATGSPLSGSLRWQSTKRSYTCHYSIRLWLSQDSLTSRDTSHVPEAAAMVAQVMQMQDMLMTLPEHWIKAAEQGSF